MMSAARVAYPPNPTPGEREDFSLVGDDEFLAGTLGAVLAYGYCTLKSSVVIAGG